MGIGTGARKCIAFQGFHTPGIVLEEKKKNFILNSTFVAGFSFRPRTALLLDLVSCIWGASGICILKHDFSWMKEVLLCSQSQTEARGLITR